MRELDDVPLPLGLKVGISYNLKTGKKEKVEDIEAEYDNIETVQAIKKVFENHGCKVELYEVNKDFPQKLRKSPPDIMFNIAEGISGRGREAEVPGLLTMMGIPYTGSDETTLCIGLDKALTKRILRTYHIKSPRSVVLSDSEKVVASFVKYPLIIKPNAEGSSKGISDISIVKNKEELKALTEKNLKVYKEDMLAEEYIEGREFTVGLIGNGKEIKAFTPMEIRFRKKTQDDYSVYSFNVKKDYKKYIEYKCPSDIDEKTQREMEKIALKVYKILGCRDFARMDFRVSESGEIYFIEINPLPGLAPEYSDYPMLADFCGVNYDKLLMEILKTAMKRLNMTNDKRKVV